MPKPIRLLAIEDSEADAELECIELRRSGFEVQLTRVDSLDALVQALRRGGWDLILCDHNLPGFSSKEALATARAEDPEVPFVILSGTIGEEAAVDALKSGARDVVIKTNLSRLGTVADRELREAAARRRHREVEVELQHS
ncbi:MAG: response regulator, partial [Gaiellaceae bacterium]